MSRRRLMRQAQIDRLSRDLGLDCARTLGIARLQGPRFVCVTVPLVANTGNSGPLAKPFATTAPGVDPSQYRMECVDQTMRKASPDRRAHRADAFFAQAVEPRA